MPKITVSASISPCSSVNVTRTPYRAGDSGPHSAGLRTYSRCRTVAGSPGSKETWERSDATTLPAASRISVTMPTVLIAIESFSTLVATSTTARSLSMSGVVTRTPSVPIRTGPPASSHVSR